MKLRDGQPPKQHHEAYDRKILEFFNVLQIRQHTTMIDKGFWSAPRGFPDEMSDLHALACRAVRSYRDQGLELPLSYGQKGRPTGVAADLAALLLYVLDTAAQHNLPLGEAVLQWMEFYRQLPIGGGKGEKVHV